jgi:murein tripeptide amidase MpaA
MENVFNEFMKFYRVIENQQPKKQRKALDWTSYWTYEEVNQWMDSLIAQYPSSVSNINYGKSFENRDLRGIKVNIGGGDKKAVVFEATMHAREWISTATTTWMVNELLTSNDPEVQELARAYEWVILPVTNPDGYGLSLTPEV